MTNSSSDYQRILVKLSGEALMGDDSYGVNKNTIDQISQELVSVKSLGIQLAVVIGGGISLEVLPPRRPAWIVPPLIIWGCWLLS